MSPPLWRQIQKENFIRLEPLADFLELSSELRENLLSRPRFPLNLPRRLAEKISKNTLDDPILRQFVPLREEEARPSGFTADPVQDTSFCKTKKLLQKYKGRSLLLTTSACAMHCRFCFRQNFPYETATAGFEEELALLADDVSISEVILSGGDPLSLGDSALVSLLTSLNALPHIKRIRFHTRFPLGIPERIDASFLRTLCLSQKRLFFVIHCNHPKELDTDILIALKEIQLLGIPILNQSVLLHNVNDNFSTLLALSEALIDAGILPYYLHLLDPVEGASHYKVSEERGKELIRSLQEVLPGFAIPRLVREEPSYPSKTLINITSSQQF